MVFGQGPLLQRTTAAGAEMLANGRDALVAGIIDVHQVTSVRMSGHRLDRYDFAR